MEVNQKHKTDLCGYYALLTYQGYINLMFERLINPMLGGSISLIIKERISLYDYHVFIYDYYAFM